MTPLSRTLLLGTAFAASALLAACTATGSVDAGLDTPLPGGGRGTIDVHVDVNGEKSLEAEATRPVCIQLKFSDSKGQDIGSAEIQVPGAAPIPPGAVRFEAMVVPCPEPKGLAGPGLGSRRLAQPYSLTWELFGGSLLPIADGAMNVNYSFLIDAPNADAAEARKELVLQGGIGTPTGPGFEVVHYSEAATEFDALGLPVGVRMRQALAADRFTAFSLVVNDGVEAQLGTTPGLLHYTDQGWDVIEVFVPIGSFQSGPGAYSNTARTEWTTSKRSALNYAEQSVSSNG